MRDHYHLLISERVEGGTSLFMRKVNIAYANYFNIRYARSGTLFQSRTKKVPITTDAQFNYILHYIHLNPLDYLKGAGDWRLRSKTGIASAREALAYLDSYRWSSHLDYVGIRNFPSLTDRHLIAPLLGDPKSYEKQITEIITDPELARPSAFLEKIT